MVEDLKRHVFSSSTSLSRSNGLQPFSTHNLDCFSSKTNVLYPLGKDRRRLSIMLIKISATIGRLTTAFCGSIFHSFIYCFGCAKVFLTDSKVIMIGREGRKLIVSQHGPLDDFIASTGIYVRIPMPILTTGGVEEHFTILLSETG